MGRSGELWWLPAAHLTSEKESGGGLVNTEFSDLTGEDEFSDLCTMYSYWYSRSVWVVGGESGLQRVRAGCDSHVMRQDQYEATLRHSDWQGRRLPGHTGSTLYCFAWPGSSPHPGDSHKLLQGSLLISLLHPSTLVVQMDIYIKYRLYRSVPL